MITPTEAAKNLFRPYLRYLSPAVRMPMSVPVIKGTMKGINNLIRRFKTTTHESQSFELLPPRFNQIEPASILGYELKANLWPSQQGGLHISAFVNNEIVFDDQPAVAGKSGNHLFQQLDMRGAIARRATENRGQTGGWFEGTMDPNRTATTVVGRESSSIWPQLPLLTGVGFCGKRPQFIQADNSSTWRRPQVGPDDGPLFSTNSGSCLAASRNQLCCRFQANPSTFSHFQMVEMPNRRPYRFSNSVCRRVKVHNSNGRSWERGFCKAMSINPDRTSSVWVTGLPERGLSSRPAIPSALKRLTHRGPEAVLANPTMYPASLASRSGSSCMALISCARWTIREGSLRDFASRLISSASSVVKVLSVTRFLGIAPRKQDFYEGLYFIY